ncbi:hypothetical protein EDL96_04300 [Kocuria soli]|uniref:Uncharacterized protein n=1 Tax=Kocuria soli TaxID=2485125 RepID=A0A3N3ZRQ1_9MICC|nr:hypothetical protein [Kocuria soli]ROZ64009.1 hypothetical protein EDL96_04300 [Kocuria soli]
MTEPRRDPEADDLAWQEIVRHLRDPEQGAPDQESQLQYAPGPDAPGQDAPGQDAPLPEDDEDWQPPDPGRVTAGMSPGAVTAWSVLAVVPVVLLALGLLLDGLPWWLWFPGLTAVITAIVVLLGGLPEERDENDDGARV